MLFVARFSNLTVTVRPALIRREKNELDQIVSHVERPALDVDFMARAMTEPQRIIAVRMFTAINPKAPWGSAPYAEGGSMGQEFGDLIMDVERYAGYNPAFNLSKYNTATDVPYEAQLAFSDEERDDLRKLVETTLLTHPELGREFVRLDETLPKPWPAYPLEMAPGVGKKIVALGRDFGIPMVEILEFEKTQDKPRPVVIAEVEAELAKIAAAEAEREALGAVIA
jgi:hypothetical protein